MTCFCPPSRFRHHTNNVPILGHHSFSLTHSHFFNLLLTATVPSSCHPARLCLPSTLPSIHRIITKQFYQILHIHLGPLHIFLGVVLRALCSFRSVKLFFLRVLPQAYFFFAPRKPPVMRWQSLLVFLSFKLAIFPSQFNSDTDVKTLTFPQFQVPIPSNASTCFDTSLVPNALYGFGVLVWVRFLRVLYVFVFWFVVFFCSTSCQW